MARRGRHLELFGKALNALRQEGYAIESPCPSKFGGHVRVLRKGGVAETTLIQTRSHQPESSRYLVGIMTGDLTRVDSVVLWFEDEASFLKIPGETLRCIFKRSRESGTARYTGAHNQQWRINVHLDEGTISAQGSSGLRYRVDEHLVENQEVAS